MKFEDYQWELETIDCYTAFREGGASGNYRSNKYPSGDELFNYHALELYFVFTHKHGILF